MLAQSFHILHYLSLLIATPFHLRTLSRFVDKCLALFDNSVIWILPFQHLPTLASVLQTQLLLYGSRTPVHLADSWRVLLTWLPAIPLVSLQFTSGCADRVICFQSHVIVCLSNHMSK